ncbi:MAG: hypothetical protein R6U55_05325 [Desulfovermiculus sp.]
MPSRNPKFAIALAYINGDGEVIRFVKLDKSNFSDDEYADDESRRIEKGARLITPNYCHWFLEDGRWKCIQPR